MSSQRRTVNDLATVWADRRLRHIWLLGGAALLLHGVFDPVVTYLAVIVFESGREGNVWLATYLHRGAWPFLRVHIPLYLGFTAALCGLTWLFTHGSDEEAATVYKIALVGWAGIIVWGLALTANNLVVLLTG